VPSLPVVVLFEPHQVSGRLGSGVPVAVTIWPEMVMSEEAPAGGVITKVLASMEQLSNRALREHLKVRM
ncbi:MAG: hypothetical protein NTY27_01615, partial [Actinobacteria bacterium]|nr:hypothetical protein [Actinomycetota bacterium]